MNTTTMVKTMCSREFLCKNASEVWHFLEYLSGKTYECETIRETPSFNSLISIAKS